ncbi:hypothetical protein KDX23_22910 [Burkholderia vietnamiensis]|uniref:hypothetical protein n=1 Tax=Burkholderia vietnamiensis TaxID=60552 RepID=UPI001B938773|nr:hypothetical protein [Burkholderia vietnamiensis]MBR8085590.1 hypothetical protein [Burkholderia vietnamiensis]
MSQEPNVVQPLSKAIAVVKWKHLFDKEIGGVGQSRGEVIAGLVRAGATEDALKRFWRETKHLSWPASGGVSPWETASAIGFSLAAEATAGANPNAFGAEYVALLREALAAKNAEDRSVSETMDERFADAIIGSRPERFDALEIQGVREFVDPSNSNASFCEVDNESPQFFSVYAHFRTGGVECVGDHGTHALAAAYANALSEAHGWPIYDYVAPADSPADGPAPARLRM